MLQNRDLPQGIFPGDSTFWKKKKKVSKAAAETEPVAKSSLHCQLALFVVQGVSSTWSWQQ